MGNSQRRSRRRTGERSSGRRSRRSLPVRDKGACPVERSNDSSKPALPCSLCFFRNSGRKTVTTFPGIAPSLFLPQFRTENRCRFSWNGSAGGSGVLQPGSGSHQFHAVIAVLAHKDLHLLDRQAVTQGEVFDLQFPSRKEIQVFHVDPRRFSEKLLACVDNTLRESADLSQSSHGHRMM